MSREQTKRRDISENVHFPAKEVSSSSNGPWTQDGIASDVKFTGKQITVSSGHRKNRKGKYDSGGPFFTARSEPVINTRSVRAKGVSSGKWVQYKGPIVIPVPASGPVGGVATMNQDSSYLDPIGATAIHLVDPTNANTQLGVDLGELIIDRKISVPGIQAWKQRTDVARAAGSEYLSAQFGWRPLVSDMKHAAQSVKDGNKIMENYRAASGSLVHREFAFDDIVNESESVLNPAARCLYSGAGGGSYAALNSPGVPLTVHTRELTKRWFSGSFTYTSGSNTDLKKCLGIGEEADKLFGLSLTPDLVWELTPWSWAIDWFSNTGDVISNASSLGLAGLVMKYGYMMEETSVTTTYSMPSTGITGVKGAPPDCMWRKVTKRRREANPFGFGLTWEGLSPTQLAITAALGITHLR